MTATEARAGTIGAAGVTGIVGRAGMIAAVGRDAMTEAAGRAATIAPRAPSLAPKA